MRPFFVCFALVIVSSLFVVPTRAQSLEDNEHYQTFQSWAIDTQQPDPVPNMFKFCIQAYDKMIASGVSPSTRVPEGEVRGIMWKGTVQEIKENWCDAGLKKITGDVEARFALPRQPKSRQAATRDRRDARGCHVVCVSRRQIHQRCKEAR